MATRSSGSSTFGDGAVRHSFFVVLWAVWAVLTANEFVGDAFGLSFYLLLLVGGFLLGGVVVAWTTRTERGRMAKRLYDDAPLGQQFAVSIALLVPLAALAYGLSVINVSLVVLLVLWISAIVGYQQLTFVTKHTRSE
ncbi:hypothetical protein [Halococcus qingdaonensis]|uniref:hypothetical protein n=1 Tax=Halococcus qingdaonensis TaxID=224402 RepID=UPI0021162F74|nr:hypothetical protein [Halococcus qingdaonensis]